MQNLPENLVEKLQTRKQNNAFRKLSEPNYLTDFSSNDYLGFAKNELIFDKSHQYLLDKNHKINGATGSRLLSGNHFLYTDTEQFISKFHLSESALIFNSGYDANVGFFSTIPQRNDIIFYDELCHASIRDGIKLSNAKSFKFNHNDFEDLEKKIAKSKKQNSNLKSQIIQELSTFNFQLSTIYIVTESVFSMDGDCPNLEELVSICKRNNCYLVVDEAHSAGVFGNSGEGLIQDLGLQNNVFARIVTFGKGLGCHGAAILCSNDLKDYLINFARSFVYTTGLSPHSVATILTAYQCLENDDNAIKKLRENINFFNRQKQILGLKPLFVRSKSAIQSAIIPGNKKVKSIANQLQINGFDVKAILSPTVPEGQERLRICLHSYNTENEISELLVLLQKIIS